jgi:hypothetical protein
MTTVTSPGGTPAVIYNLSGMTIDSITPAGTTQATATPVARYATYTVVLDSNTGSGSNTAGILLPVADIGDVVEVHTYYGMNVYPDSGSSIVETASGANAPLHIGGTRMFRKIGASLWSLLSA